MNNIVNFPAVKQAADEVTVPVPNAIPQDEMIGTMTVNGDSLEGVGIYDGEIVLVRRIRGKHEIGPDTLCVIDDGFAVRAGKIRFEGDDLLFLSCKHYPDRLETYKAAEVEIRGVIISATRQKTAWPHTYGMEKLLG